MSKRFLLLLVLLAVLVTFGWAAPKTTIVHYAWTETFTDPILLNAVKMFETKHPDVDVKMLLLPDADRPNIIRTVLAANGQIDSFGLDNGESAEFLAAGQAIPIDPRGFGKKTVDDVVAMWTPGAIESDGGVWNGVYYGIPNDLSDYVAWINTSYMKEAGLNPATDTPKTWDDFVAVGKKLVKSNGNLTVRNGFMCNAKEGIFNFLVVLSMMEQLGLDWGTEKGLLASMDKPEVLARGLSTYTNFVVKDKIWDPALDDNDREGFGNGKSGMFLTGGTWYWGVLDTYSVKRKDVEPFPYPRFPDGKDIGGVGYGYCWYVSRLAKDPVLTWEWLDTLTSQANVFIKGGLYQPRLKLSNGAQALDPKLAMASIPYYAQVFKGEYAKPAVWLSSTKGAQVTSTVWDAISRIIYQGASVEDSVATLQSDIRGIFQ